jgi:hypothetical protein
MTTFIRLLQVDLEQKPAVLRQAVEAGRREGAASRLLFNVNLEQLSRVPRTPFCYWVSPSMLQAFVDLPALQAEDGSRRACAGAVTNNNDRFVRTSWEVADAEGRWTPLAKGGAYSKFYSDVHLLLAWADDGYELKTFVSDFRAAHGWSAHWAAELHNANLYLRPGLTWPLRTLSGLGMRVLPAGTIFGHKGPAIVLDDPRPDALLSLLALVTSAPFEALVELLMTAASYEVGVIQRAPLPMLSFNDEARLAGLARRAWSLKRALDTSTETSHAFVLPAILSKLDRGATAQELAVLQAQINDLAFDLYGIGAEDRAIIEAAAKPTAPDSDDAETEESNESEDADDETVVGDRSEALGSWLVGVAFGRFDARLATGERAIPPEPEPFDPLPSRSPGMYPEGEGPADRPDILVDDEGHADDLAARAIAVAERVKVDAPENLRAWVAKEFFPLHIKMYSKSRRKAPIYWQLATASAGYSVWLYIHAFSKDTLFRVQNDYGVPKLAHEERRLESLTSELRDGATAVQRKTLAAQEAVVDELRAFLDEVKRVAPLWKPNLDDGVIINFAPLWRLVPQNKAWQKELKSTWDALCDGKYDWARLAMHLWPERVVPQCAKDRSLAIAHGLEDVFWVEGNDGKWTARNAPTKSVDELVKERTSPAVKSALKSLLEAPVASGKSTGRKGGGRRKAAATGEGGDA